MSDLPVPTSPDPALARSQESARVHQTLADFTELLNGTFRRLDPHEVDYPDIVRAAALMMTRLGHRNPVLIKPAPGESGRDILRRLAAANRMRIRNVTLDEGDLPAGEAMVLAFSRTDRQPVVLLPRGVRLVPSDAGSARPRRLKPGEGGELERAALCFHPILPDGVIPWRTVAGFGLAAGRPERLPLVVCTLLAAILSMALPALMGVLVTAISRAEEGFLAALIAALVFALVCQVLFQTGEKFAISRFEARTGLDLQAALVDRALRLPAEAFHKSTSVILATQLESVDKLRRSMLRFALTGTVAVVNGAVAAVVMAYFHFPAAGVAVLLGAILAGLTAVLGWRQFRAIYEGERMDVIVLAFVYDLVRLVPVIRGMARERAAFIHWAQNYLAFQARLMRATEIYNRYSALVSAWQPATLALCFAAIAFAPIGTVVGVAAALGFISALERFIAATLEASAAIMGAAKALPMGKLSRSFLDYQLEPPSAGQPLATGEGVLQMLDVSFGYGDRPVLTEVSLRIAGGEFVGITGPSGAGKSTLIRLLLGLEAPKGGHVLIDGNDLRKLDRRQISGAVGLVMQDGRPMAGSVLENIRGVRDLSIEHAWDLVRLVGLEPELRSRPMGIHTLIGEGGAGLSSADVQRLQIARALALQPSILIIDESMNAIPVAERTALLARLSERRLTLVVVSHDLAALSGASRLLLVAGGTVREVSSRTPGEATGVAG